RDQRRNCIIARVVDDELVPGRNKPARNRLPHIAEADEADVHVWSSFLATFEEQLCPRPNQPSSIQRTRGSFAEMTYRTYYKLAYHMACNPRADHAPATEEA